MTTTPSARPTATIAMPDHGEEAVLARAQAIARRSTAGRRLPALARLLERLRSGCSARELAAAVHTSPDLATRVLRLANSAAYAPRRPITALDRAIAFIGDIALRQLVLVTAVLARASATPDRTVRYAVARGLAARTGWWEPSEAFTLGLVAELGQVELVEYGGPRYAELVLRASDPDATAPAELALVGTTHTAVGRALAEAWSLPGSVATVMAAHHHSVLAPGSPGDPVRGQPTEVDLVRAAAWLVRDGLAPSPVPPEVIGERCEAALAAPGLERTTLRSELEALRPVVAELLTVFDLGVADPSGLSDRGATVS